MYKSDLEKVVLENGVTVLHDRFPQSHSVGCVMCLAGGSRDETSNTNGISHLLEHMLFRRTKTKTTNQIASVIDQFGGDINAVTTANSLCLFGVVPSRRYVELLEFFAELLFQSSFVNEDLEVEKEIVRQEILESADDTYDSVSQYFSECFWPRSSLGYPVFGTVDTVGRFTCRSLRRRLSELLVGRRIIISVVGDIPLKAVLLRLKSIFGHLEPGKPSSNRTPVTGSGIHLLSRDVNQSYVIFGKSWPAMSHPDYLSGLLVSSVLGEGMSSRLFQLVREKHGFAYSISSDVDAYSDTACLSITAVVEKKYLQRAVRYIVEEVEKLSSEFITADEFQRAIESVSAQLEMSVDQVASRMWRAVETQLHLGRYVSVEEVIAKVKQITFRDIKRVIEEWLASPGFLLVVGGNVKGFRPNSQVRRLCEG